MIKPVATLLIGLGLAAAPACGRKGPLVIPPGRAPMPVEALAAAAAGGAIVLRWTNPTKQISGRPLGPLGAVEVWVFERGLPPGKGALTSEAIEKAARLLRKVPAGEFGDLARAEGGASGVMTFSYVLPATADAPSQLAFTVRVFDRKGRASDFAAPAVVDLTRKDPGIDLPAAEGVS